MLVLLLKKYSENISEMIEDKSFMDNLLGIEVGDKEISPTYLHDGIYYTDRTCKELFTGIYHYYGEIYHLQNGLSHRLDGPAFINDVTEQWFLKGKHHRYDGPAMMGLEDREWKKEYWWYLNDILYFYVQPEKEKLTIYNKANERKTLPKAFKDELIRCKLNEYETIYLYDVEDA
jgi:hypothetical protein